MRSIFAIIVTYNSDINVLKQQYFSVVEQVDYIIYIDNGSNNIEEIDKLFRSFNQQTVCMIRLEFNRGLGYAQNIGLNLAITNKASHVLLLDHDSILESDFVSKLYSAELKCLGQGLNLAAIGPIYYDIESKKQFPVFKYNKYHIKKMIPKDNIEEVSFLIASGTFIRTEILKDIGLMNEDFFVDFIDYEWCTRALINGYKLYITPDAKMMHTVGDKRIKFFSRFISFHSPIRRYYLTRNTVCIWRFKGFPLSFKIRESFLTLLRFFISIFRGPSRYLFLKYCILGCYHGFIGKMGPLIK